MVNLDRSWNLDLFRVWVIEDVINRITSIPPPHPDSGSDKVIWARSVSRVFLIRNVLDGKLVTTTLVPYVDMTLRIWRMFFEIVLS
ncbi:hypothetical protein Gotri_016029 [Gossypium trilobum]|uniref:Uncharacterized protein n=1 Tax=Gossypium trilobum TaxID=34281 RepID=A0A7J9E238_9ROSI|nr:hypothetical protein [Gossypium trilobum]